MRELLEELDGADLEAADGRSPHIERDGGVSHLWVEGARIPLAYSNRLEEALTWAISFTVLQQKLPAPVGPSRGLRCAATFMYRYALGINGGLNSATGF